VSESHPLENSSLPLSAVDRIDIVCDRFASALRAGHRPRLEEFLAGAEGPEREALLRELLRELADYLPQEQRRRWLEGERVSVREHLREMPELRQAPDVIFELVCQEVLLREELGDAAARPEDYLDLLPGHEAQIRRFFAGRQPSPRPTQGVPRDRATQPRAPEVETPAAAGRPVEPPAPSLERYQVSSFIGRGGMGDVFWVHDPHLGRDLALKVLREDRREPHLVRRFLEEARLHSRLQHPGVAPVHELGDAADGRPYFTMKLVKGHTLVELLEGRAGPSEDLPRLLSIFEQVCQAVAYAHAEGVLHRDLKPHNLMVGAFGEVQVMDWGLAKDMRRATAAEAPPAAREAGAAESALWETVDEAHGTRPGEAMGTPAYMAPEQARGEWHRVDERADVFALGAILCQVLTGRPPFTRSDSKDLFAKAQACDRTEALARLDGCGADPRLLRLAKACLAARPGDRPRNAGTVAKEVKAYLAGVQERLRAAEREQAAAQARAEAAKATAAQERKAREEAQRRAAAEEARAAAERRAKHRLLGLAAAVVLLLAGVGGFWWWQQQAERAVGEGLTEAERLYKQAREAPLEPGKYDEAVRAARVARELAGGATPALRRRAKDFLQEVEREADAAARDRRLLAQVLDVRGPRESPRYVRGEKETMIALAEPTADEQFAAAFRDWGLDVDNTPTAEAAARLKGRPPAVVTEVVVALDEWASQRRIEQKPEAEWRRLAELAAALEDEPDSMRQELREILARGRLPLERALGVLSAALRPVPVPVEVPLGADRGRLRRLAGRIDPATESVLGLLTLIRALRVAREEALAEQLLRAAVQARPREVVLYHALGHLLVEQEPPRWPEAVEFYRAARALRPDLGVELAEALLHSGHAREGLTLLARLVRERPDNPFLHFQQGFALDRQGDWDGAIACYQRAIVLDPKSPPAHNNLGVALYEKRDLDGAIACYDKAIAIDPKLAKPHNNLGNALRAKGRPDEALAEYRRAIALEPKLATAHNNLGTALYDRRRLDEAIAEYRQAIALDPKYAAPHNNLGAVLRDKGRLDEAMAEYRQAIALDPKRATVHQGLGDTLADTRRWDEAVAEYRQAIALDPKRAVAHNNLGLALAAKGRLDEAMAEYRTAIALDPKLASAHYNLGNALRAKGRLDEAMAEYRTAIAIDPKDAMAHTNLGLTLRAKGRLDEAMAEYQKAIAIDPKRAMAHNNLGAALAAKGRLDEAMAEFRQAIDLDPKLVLAHNNLGLALARKGRLDEAVAEFRQAIDLDPMYAPAHQNLGAALTDTGDLEGAIACFRKAIALDPKDPQAWGGLGQALLMQGRYGEARDAIRRALQLLPASHPLRRVVAPQLRTCEELLALDGKLPPVLGGEETPANPGEAVTLARMCQKHKKRHAAAARLYADAFAAEPRLAADLNQQHRYNAACSAALAAAGQGEDARLLPDKVAGMFRNWALTWLRDDLKAYDGLAGQANPAVRQAVRQRLLHWQKDPDLAGLRDKDAVDKLPEAERDACRRLWADVDALLQRTQEK
jgi:serine/threonine-protein kinase